MRRLVAEQVLLPRFARARIDLVHSLATLAPVWTPVPAVITFHDVTFLRVRTFSFATTFAFRAIVGLATRHADALLTALPPRGTRSARRSDSSPLASWLSRMARVVRRPVRSPREERYSPLSSALTARVWCCASARSVHTRTRKCCYEPRRFCQTTSPSCLSAIPSPMTPSSALSRLELGVAERVRFLDYAPDRDLEALWRIADCAAFPTLGEGFGLPVLEAMQRGVPVACSDIPVLREVGR